MNTAIPTRDLLPESNYTCFVVPALFSEEECNALLKPEIKNAFQKAQSNYPTYYRNNDRFVMDDTSLAHQLFEKVKSYLPDTIHTTSNIALENGAWHLKELNNRLRFCKYGAHQYFHRHLDGIHYRSDTVQSKLTFMIYLNGASDFKGGRTLFYKTKDTTEIWATYIPQQGDLIVFDHNVWHEGEVLTEGEKFVLRSDILYYKEAAPIIHIAPFSGHKGYIWSLLKINDDTILSGGRDKEIKAWTLSGALKYNLKAHENSILCIEKMTDTIFISGSRDRNIIVWKEDQPIKHIQIHDAIILSLCKLDDNTFASGSGDNTIKIANLNGIILANLNEHSNWVWQVVKITENVIASASEDGSIKIWDLHTKKSLHTFQEEYPIISLAFNAATSQLISGNLVGDITIRTLDSTYQQQDSKTFKAHTGIIRTIKIIDNHLIATGGEDNMVMIWNADGTKVTSFHHQNFVQAVEVIDSNTILTASYDGTIVKRSI